MRSSTRTFGRPYWGWVMVAALGVTTCASYGILSYAFAVFLAPMEGELGWSRTQLTGAFSLSWLVAGIAGVPIGRWVDRHGARGVMTAGSVVATALLLAWSRVERLSTFYAIWIALGVAAAAVLYEPAFVVVAVWFERRRASALTLLTFLGGLASVLFVPLASRLVHAVGWRDALGWLAAILGAVTIPLHALVLRRRPADLGLLRDGAPKPARVPSDFAPSPARTLDVSPALRGAPFLLLTAAFSLTTLASTAMTVHLVPLLMERRYSAEAAAGALALLGLWALPGRLLFTPLGGRLPRAAVAAAIFVLQALSSIPLLASDSTGALWAFVALFGAGFGAVTPARAALVADLYGAEAYGSISGVLTLVLSLARAAAPVGASVVHAATGDYRAVILLALVASVVAAVLTLGIRGPAAHAPAAVCHA